MAWIDIETILDRIIRIEIENPNTKAASGGTAFRINTPSGIKLVTARHLTDRLFMPGNTPPQYYSMKWWRKSGGRFVESGDRIDFNFYTDPDLDAVALTHSPKSALDNIPAFDLMDPPTGSPILWLGYPDSLNRAKQNSKMVLVDPALGVGRGRCGWVQPSMLPNCDATKWAVMGFGEPGYSGCPAFVTPANYDTLYQVIDDRVCGMMAGRLALGDMLGFTKTFCIK